MGSQLLVGSGYELDVPGRGCQSRRPGLDVVAIQGAEGDKGVANDRLVLTPL